MSGQPPFEAKTNLENPTLQQSKKAVFAFDRLLGSLSKQDLFGIRRWQEVGNFGAMLIGAKPSALVHKGWGEWMIAKIKNANPSLEDAYETYEVRNSKPVLIVNKEKTVEVFKKNPDYFPEVSSYDEVKTFLKGFLEADTDKVNEESTDYQKRLVQLGLVLGYPKSDSQQFAKLNKKTMLQLVHKINNPHQGSADLGIPADETRVLLRFNQFALNNAPRIVTAGQQEAQSLAPKVKEILGRVQNVDPEVKDYFLHRRGFNVKQVQWIGRVGSKEGSEVISRMGQLFQDSGLNDMLRKYDIVLQGHSDSIFQQAAA